MLRSKQIVEKLRVAHGSPSSLAHLYWQLLKPERLKCQSLCDEINHPWQKSLSSPPVTASALEQALFVNLCSENHNMIWTIASKINDMQRAGRKGADAVQSSESTNGLRNVKNSTDSDSEIITPKIYLLLLSSIVKSRSNTQVHLAFRLFREFSTLSPSDAEVQLACTLLFSAAKFCDNFSLLFDLRLVFESAMIQSLHGFEDLRLQYAGASLHILLNTGQYVSAVKCLEETLSSVDEYSAGKVFSALPMSKFWAQACFSRDFRVLADSLEAYLMCTDVPAIPTSDWMQYLGLGLAHNDYKLVRVVYGALSNLGVSLSSSIVAQIVQVFSTQGDVDQVTKIIEEHYLYLKGEKALTKELSLSIISAYCHHLAESAGSEDSSWFSVLDAIDAFSRRLHFSYHEISDAVSYKLNHLSILDDKVELAKRKNRFRVKQQLEDREAEMELHDVDQSSKSDAISLSLPIKSTNSNVRSGDQGNVLRNMEVLSEFSISTMKYMQQKSFGLHVKQLIVNCILSHITLYQNFSAAVYFLGALQKVEPDFTRCLLNSESYEIIFESLSRSPASVECGFYLFQNQEKKDQLLSENKVQKDQLLSENQVQKDQLLCENEVQKDQFLSENQFQKDHSLSQNQLQKNHSLSQHQMECLVISSLRGSQFNQLLEFYCHQLVSRGYSASKYLIQRILKYDGVNDQARTLVEILQDCKPGNKAWIAEKWSQNNFHCSMEGLQMPEIHESYANFDARDCKLLEEVFGNDSNCSKENGNQKYFLQDGEFDSTTL